MGDEGQRADGGRAEVLRAEGLSRRLADGTTIVDDVTFSVARGEVVVVEDRLGITMTEIIKTERS